MTNVLSACQVSSGNDIRGCYGKKNQHSKIDYFFAMTSTNVISLWNLAITQNIGQSLPPIFLEFLEFF